MTSCADVLEPLQSIDGDLESLNDWLDDAERMITSDQIHEIDLGSQYKQHEVLFMFCALFTLAYD